MLPTRFENLHDLARLPWFAVREGRLVVDDPSLPLAIDLHTHLALSYVRRRDVDLRRRSRARHYLPAERAVDLDVYQNRNFTPEDLSSLKRDLTLSTLLGGGIRATHTLPNLLDEMKELRIACSVLLPIDLPRVSDNAREWLHVTRGEPAIVCFGSVHPWERDVEVRLDEQVALGARGIKVHPAVQMVRPDAERCMALYRACGRRKLPVLFHCGPVDIETRLGRYLSQVRHYERALAECPETTFVLGHSGALQMPEALAFAHRYPNVWLELASQSVSNVRRLVTEAPRGRTVFGTDWPFYHQATGLAKVLLATEGDDALRREVLHDNAARLLGAAAPATAS
ncbi:MAG: amidohydrolase family protein [Polyangiaceae bacterium]|nr:amidohydrolase family protein [Polyangiaceae bacterium]